MCLVYMALAVRPITHVLDVHKNLNSDCDVACLCTHRVRVCMFARTRVLCTCVCVLGTCMSDRVSPCDAVCAPTMCSATCTRSLVSVLWQTRKHEGCAGERLKSEGFPLACVPVC